MNHISMKPIITYLNTRTLFILIFLSACAPTTTNTEEENVGPAIDSSALTVSPVEETQQVAPAPEPDSSYDSPGPAKVNEFGVVRYKWGAQMETLNIYNEDGSLWKTYVDSIPDAVITPFRMKPDYSLIVFRCIGKTSLGYEVVVNEEHNIIKYIKTNAQGFVHESWEEHILGLNGIGFDQESNPLKESPSDNAATVSLEGVKDESFSGVSIQGEWLHVKTENGTEGWIRWHDANGKLLIELYYLC